MIGVLRWVSRLTVLVGLVAGLFLVLAVNGPPEWLYRKDIAFAHAIAQEIVATPSAMQRLNDGAALWDVLPQHTRDIKTTGLSYRGGVLLLPTDFDSAHYYDIQGACWNFVRPRLTALEQCER